MEWTIPSTLYLRVVPIIVSEPSSFFCASAKGRGLGCWLSNI